MRISKGRMQAGLVGALLAAMTFAVAMPSTAAAAPRWEAILKSNSAAAPGSTLTLGGLIQNTGDAGAPGTLTATVALPTDLSAVSTSLGWTCAGDGPGAAPNVVGAANLTCTQLGAFAGDAGAVLRVVAAVDASATAGAPRTARMNVYAPGGSLGPDGAPCASAPPGAPCASAARSMLIEGGPIPFGVEALDAAAHFPSAALDPRAGVHPYAQTTWVSLNTKTNPNGVISPALPGQDEGWPAQPPRDLVTELPPGFLGNLTGFERCTLAQLTPNDAGSLGTRCPTNSQVGLTRPYVDALSTASPLPLYNMEPPPGVAVRMGFQIARTPTVVDFTVRSHSDYGVTATLRNINQGLAITGGSLTVWGDPGDPVHDYQRSCPEQSPATQAGGPSCKFTGARVPLLRNPTSCGPTEEGMTTTLHADSWRDSAAFNPDGSPNLSDPKWHSISSDSHEAPGFPLPPSEWGPEKGTTECAKVPVKGKLSASPTSRDTTTPSGLQVKVEVPNPGLDNPDGIASSDVSKVRVALPEGMTINPSQAEGLGVCSEAQYESSKLSFLPENPTGCPSDSKIGTVEVVTPLLEEKIPGEVFVAEPFQNPFGSLLALYVVLEEPQRGVLVKLAGEVKTDPVTGQITTIFSDLPQQPFTSFDFKFREGARAPLVTPQSCATYTTTTEIWGHSNPSGKPVLSKSSFQIDRGIGGGPCPSGDLPPFKPLLQAGTVNNAAGSHSPFNLRLARTDAEQEFTNFSIKLPPGVTGKLAGIPFCPDQAIEAARHRTGAQELSSPSCPASSEVGRTLAGAGVGAVQTYAPGKIYLAGPYNGSALSIVSVTAAKVGPFDLGTVVVRLALKVDPTTAEVFVDATGSDPIPHIIDGITVHLRDIRAYVDRPDFVLNPTSCAPTSTASTVLGSGLDFASGHDDVPVVVSTRFQAADCAALAFKPRLAIRLLGKTRRGGNPALRATLKMKGTGESNIAKAQVTLPRSAFLDQEHIDTICTRVQYAADSCPKGSIYGYARAITPLLDEPIQGPVHLRSSENPLPDLVASLKSGRIEIDLVGRIDSPGKGGRIRTTFEAVPDAPVSSFVLTMRGGRKSLIENSTNLCKGRHRAIVNFDAHNGKIADSKPAITAKCKGKARRSSPKTRP